MTSFKGTFQELYRGFTEAVRRIPRAADGDFTCAPGTVPEEREIGLELYHSSGKPFAKVERGGVRIDFALLAGGQEYTPALVSLTVPGIGGQEIWEIAGKLGIPRVELGRGAYSGKGEHVSLSYDGKGRLSLEPTAPALPLFEQMVVGGYVSAVESALGKPA